MLEKEWRKRLRFMIDLIFTSAMTILIINFNIPESVESESTQVFLRVLIGQSTQFTMFVISFLVIAVYWVKNLEYFRMIKNIDKTIIWSHMLYLILIMQLPVLNLMFGLFPMGLGIRVTFSILMIAMGLITFFIMYYAYRKGFLHNRFELSYVKVFTRQLLHEPTVALIAAALAFVQPVLWDLSFILIPLLLIAGKRIKAKYITSYITSRQSNRSR